MKLPIVLTFGSLTSSAIALSSADAVCMHLYSTYPNITALDPRGPHTIENVWNDAQYSNAAREYWNGVNARNRPACVFFPHNAQQVSTAITLLNQYPDTRFALKSGGHNFNVGVSSTDGGVLISFNENMAAVALSADGKSFAVGAGARWGDVYEAGVERHKIAVGGRLSNIGVAGFTLGGGMSYLSPQYGLACDNILDAEVVLGNGTITNANSTYNPDLWWALKGGGNRFAIVTRFSLKAYPAGLNGQVWGGTRVYSPDDRQAVFTALSQFIRDYPDTKAAVIPTFNFQSSGAGPLSSPVLFFFYDGSSPPPHAFGKLEAIKTTLDTTTTTTYLDLTNQVGGGRIQGINTAAQVNTFPNMAPKDTNQLLEAHWQLYQDQMKNDSSRSISIQVGTFTPQPLSVKVAEASVARGGNALGLDPANGDRIWVENDLIWANPVCNDACPKYLREVVDKASEFIRQFHDSTPTNYQSGNVSFVSRNPLFMNDAASYQDVYSSYGENNKARLQAIAKDYDPEGVLDRQGGWPLETVPGHPA